MNTSLNIQPEFIHTGENFKIADSELAEIVNQNLSEAVFRCSESGVILYVNRAFCKLFKVDDLSKVLGKKTKCFYKQTSCIEAINDHLKKNDEGFVGEVEFRRLDESIFYGKLSAKLIQKDEEVFVDGIIQDISSEKSYQLKIEQQTKIQELMLKISSSFLDSDLEHVNTVIDNSLKEVGIFLGIDRVHVRGYNFEENVCEITHEWVTKGTTSLIDENNNIPLRHIDEMVKLHEQGIHLFYPLVSALPQSPLKEVLTSDNINSTLTIPMKLDNQCVGFISLDSIHNFALEYDESTIAMLKLFANMIANISTRAKGHIRLKKLIDRVALQGKQRADFSFITSHNIRSSVANLVAIADQMNHEYSDEYLEMLNVTVSKLNESISNVNDILHVDHEKLLKRTVCDVNDSLSRVLNNFEGVIEDRQLIIEREVPTNLYLNTISSYLDNILFQIISNAIEFGTNDFSRKISINSSKLEDRVEIVVRDYGNGFDLEKHSHQMFKVGSRFDRNISDGQGLGLYITKLQMESLDGEIDIKSVKSLGTTVILSFPDI